MALTCDVYKSGLKLGSGSATDGSATIGSFTATAPVGQGRNIAVTITQAGVHAGRTWLSRVAADGGSSLTLVEPCPFIE